MKYLIAAVLVWVLCGLYSWGTVMAYQNYEEINFYEDNQHTPRDNVGICALTAITGPVGAFVSAIITNFNQHGWTLYK